MHDDPQPFVLLAESPMELIETILQLKKASLSTTHTDI